MLWTLLALQVKATGLCYSREQFREEMNEMQRPRRVI